MTNEWNQFWLSRWSENRIGFHRPEVNPLLERFLSRVVPRPGRVLVPLCGKSADLAWLAREGWETVGVDLSEMAARDFGRERGFAFSAIPEPPFVVFREESVTFYVGDFFELTAERVGRFDLVYDRAALIALPEDRRPAYAARLRSFLRPEGRILLVSLDYDPVEMDGPPFNVSAAEIRDLFSGLEIEELHTYDCLEEETRFKERGMTWMTESVYEVRVTASVFPPS